MVFLAITPEGLKEALRLKQTTPLDVWCGAGAISEAEYKDGSFKGVSRFIYDFAKADSDALAGALDTMKEHHPGETVWIKGLTMDQIR